MGTVAIYYPPPVRASPVLTEVINGHHHHLFRRRVLRACRWAYKTALGRPATVLVEIRWRLGDEVMALPVYEALRAAYPRCRIEVLCNYPDLLIDYPGIYVNPSQPDPDRFILLRGAPRDVFRPDHYARLAGLPALEARPRLRYACWDSPLLGELPAGEGPLIALTPGASWATKRWPRECWRKLACMLQSEGYRLIELGLEGEAVGAGVDFTGRTSVREAAVLLHHCAAAVACDSGLMHLALAAGTPVVALFGPTDPTILVRDTPDFHAVTNARECQGCWNRSMTMTQAGVCPLGIDPCLGTIDPAQVAVRVRAACRR